MSESEAESNRKALQDKKDRFKKKRLVAKKREQRANSLKAQNAKD